MENRKLYMVFICICMLKMNNLILLIVKLQYLLLKIANANIVCKIGFLLIKQLRTNLKTSRIRSRKVILYQKKIHKKIWPQIQDLGQHLVLYQFIINSYRLKTLTQTNKIILILIKLKKVCTYLLKNCTFKIEIYIIPNNKNFNLFMKQYSNIKVWNQMKNIL